MSGTMPRMETSPYVGFNPVNPHHEEGMRMEPPVSVPSAAKHNCPATAAPDPEDDPPVTRSRAHGLCVVPKADTCPVPPAANSCKFSFPITTAPAAFNRRVTS